MLTITRKITREQYDEIMTTSNGKGFVQPYLETKYFDAVTLCGYGLYGTKAYEKDGEYFLEYQTGSSCD